jgi:hypothetical protein
MNVIIKRYFGENVTTTQNYEYIILLLNQVWVELVAKIGP